MSAGGSPNSNGRTVSYAGPEIFKAAFCDKFLRGEVTVLR